MKSVKQMVKEGLVDLFPVKDEEDLYVINKGIDLKWDNWRKNGYVLFNPGHE